MNSNYSHGKEKVKAKLGENGCGKIIAQTMSENFSREIRSGEKHKCQNYGPYPQRRHEYIGTTITEEQGQYMETVGPLITETYSIVQELRDNFKKLMDNKFDTFTN